MKVLKVTRQYFETEDEKVYFFEPLEKDISIKDLQKIVQRVSADVKSLALWTIPNRGVKH